jgi:peptide/nickel transport system substrate-binding protein
MRRRRFLAAAASTLALPHIARADPAASLRFVPAADIAAIDPVWTTASQTRDHAMLVYDTLYGLDDTLRPRPQMVEGHVVSADGRTWTLTLRPGLVFHDGARVLARDCVASIRRWGARDGFGQILLAAADEISAADDRTIVLRMKYAFALVPDALAKTSSPCVIMPERLALTDPFKAVTDPTGSGPYRFLADERVAGAHLGYARFDRYVPRPDGVPQGTSGPKLAHIERVEWLIMPDGATAAAALANGEVDWLRWPLVDLLPRLRKTPNVTVKVIEPTGLIGTLRFNHQQAPFNNPLARRAILPALAQAD